MKVIKNTIMSSIELIIVPVLSIAVPLIVILIDRWMKKDDEIIKVKKGIISEIEYNLAVSHTFREWVEIYKKESKNKKVPTFSIPMYQTSMFEYINNSGFILDLEKETSVKLRTVYLNLNICNSQFRRVDRLRYEPLGSTNLISFLDSITGVTSSLMSIIDPVLYELRILFKKELNILSQPQYA